MKLASYMHRSVPCFGSVVGDGIIDLSRRVGARYPDIRALLAGGALAQAQDAIANQAPDLKLAEARLLPVIPNPGKIFCIGLNYDDHRKEGKHAKTEAPAVFVRFAESQVGHGQAMLRPRESQKFDYEGEIAVIIGQGGRREPPLWMKPGDVVEVEVDRVGVLRNTVADD